jgi:hypothetical protein
VRITYRDRKREKIEERERDITAHEKQIHTERIRAKESQVQWRRGVSPTAMQHAHATK